jgi:Flp pilus assembly protein TadG
MRRRAYGNPVHRGAAVVELALALPVLIVLFLGLFEAARLCLATQLLTTAAREGCRVAVVPGNGPAEVQARVDRVLSGSGITVGTVAPTPEDWQAARRGDAVTLTLSVPYRQVSWLPGAAFFPDATVTGSATMSCERP